MYQRKPQFSSGGRRARRRRGRSAGLLLPVLLFLLAGAIISSRWESAKAGGAFSSAPEPVNAVLPPEESSENDGNTRQPENPSLPPEEDKSASSSQTARNPELPPVADVPAPHPVVPAPQEPDVPDRDDWHLLLVNPWNFMPEDYSVTLKDLGGGHAVDERCYDDLQAMMDACKAAGLSPYICSSYRTQEKQEYLYQRKIKRLMAKGCSEAEATVEAGKVVAVPGTSEHQLGLALDIVDVRHQTLDRSQEETAVQQWLMAHSWEYGFILRYPNDKSDVTGIIYEPWHYRYVGREAAAEIFEQGVCLEEYLGEA